MEPAQIDWKRIDSRFVEDVFYEHIRAPKWFDFLSPHPFDDSNDDDDAWFCRPDCNHPKRPEDFLNSSKYPTPRDTNQSPEKNQRRRGHALSPSTSNHQDNENQNPNLATTPPSHQAKSWRSTVLKSTSVKKTNKETPRLKSTQSAINLFQGREILGHISEFCYELKRLATRVTEREVKESHHHHHQVGVINQPYSALDLELKKERKPLLEMSIDKLQDSSADVKGSNFKDNRRRKKRVEDAENIPVLINVKNNREDECTRKKRVDDVENIIPSPLTLETVKNKGHERLMQIRTNPPSPQCFSENRTASSKVLRATKTTERGKVEEVVKRKEDGEVEVESKGLDVLWFLKPCTMAN